MLKTLTSVAALLAYLVASPAYGQYQTLNKILEDVRASYNKQERPMVIFNMEGTLFDNRPRHLRILQEFANSELKTARPEAAQRISQLTLVNIQYRITDTLSNVMVMEPDIVNNAAVFWGERFFTDDYLKYDVPVPGAVAYVRSLYSAGARIVYVTGRDAPRQLLGSVRQLRDTGFPIGIMGSELIMKPAGDMLDPVFKQQVTGYLHHYGKVVAAFDAEPANANVYRRAFPDATCVLFNGSLHAPNQPPLIPDIVQIAAFQ